MREISFVLLILAAVVALVSLARRLGQPYPILLVLGGLAVSFIPGLPTVELEPDVVFLLILPPILFAAAYFTSIRDLRRYARPIFLLAIGLVLATTVVVAVVVEQLIPGLGWPIAFALGAIVSPPDAIAATAIANRLGVDRRIVVILEGESLVNDATALVTFRTALIVAATGTFSPAEAVGQFLFVGLGGAVVGLFVGWLTIEILRRLDDAPVEIAITMLAPFAAYLPAEQLHVSGVIATVVAGLMVGIAAPKVLASRTRVQGTAAWEMLLFALNGLAFILIGLQLPAILEAISDTPPIELVGLALAVSLTVIVVRILWVFPGAYVPRMLSRRIRERERRPRPEDVTVVAWAGMRGVVSLAAALSLPLTLNGEPFPNRDLLIFVTFCVILATLVGQGLTLPALIRFLGVGDNRSTEHEVLHARSAVAEAALVRIDELADDWPAHRELIDQLRATYEHRAAHVAHDDDGDGSALPAADVLSEAEQEAIDHQRIRSAVIDAEREALLALRDEGSISGEAVRVVERDLDLDELRSEA